MSYAKSKCVTCMIPSKDCYCPLASTPDFPCGFDAREFERRKALPLKWDRETRTRRKYVGVKKNE